MINVLVTGANGQLGMTLQDISKRYVNKEFNFVFVSREELDICSPDAVNTIMLNNFFDYCINCAAYTNVELAETEKVKAFDINADGAKNLAFFCDRHDITLIHISTDYVFNGKKDIDYDESDNIGPINIYGETKLKGEAYIKLKMQEYYIVRTSWLYSPHGKNFFNTVMSKLENDEHMRIATDQIGSPTSTYALSEAIIHLMLNDSEEFGIYHVANQGATNWYGFANEIALLHDKDGITPIDSYPTIAKRPAFSVLDSNKFERTFNYDMPHWLDSLKEVYDKR